MTEGGIAGPGGVVAKERGGVTGFLLVVLEQGVFPEGFLEEWGGGASGADPVPFGIGVFTRSVDGGLLASPTTEEVEFVFMG